MSLQSFNVRANSIPIAKKSLWNQSTDLDDRSVDRGPIQSARGAIQREGRASSSGDSKVSAETWSLHFLSSPGHRGMFLWPSSHPKSARILSPGRCRRYTCRFSFSFFLFFLRTTSSNERVPPRQDPPPPTHQGGEIFGNSCPDPRVRGWKFKWGELFLLKWMNIKILSMVFVFVILNTYRKIDNFSERIYIFSVLLFIW